MTYLIIGVAGIAIYMVLGVMFSTNSSKTEDEK